MKKKRIMQILVVLVLISSCVHAQVHIPTVKDKYSKIVAKLEAGETDIDYSDLRFSYIESVAYKLKKHKQGQFDSLENSLFKEMGDGKYENASEVARKMLSMDYTCLYAQKYLSKCYKHFGDSLNYRKYQTIELNLFRSIFKQHDGKSCEDLWEAAQVNEEYFVLDMMDAKLVKQTLISCGKQVCDDMEVKNSSGDTVHYYFDVTKMMVQSEKDLNGKL